MQAHGTTLIELLVCLTVLAIGLGGGVSLYTTFLPQARLIADTNSVVGLLALARNKALLHETVIVCAIDSDCTQFNNAGGLKLVIDANHNGRHDSGDMLFARIRLHHDRISWHSFRNLPRLTYRNSGLAYFQNGHLLICGQQQARSVVINAIGRTRVEKVGDFSQACH